MNCSIKSGIYKITNVNNGKVYIGSSNNIERRWTRHKADLKGGYHSNVHLQRAYDKYGLESFLFEVIEKCEESKLLEFEQHFIDKYKAYDEAKGFNMCEVAGSPTMRGENHYLYKQYGKLNPRSKPIVKLDMDFNFIERYESTNLCMRITGIDASTISKVCRGEKATFKNSIWMYEDDYKKFGKNKPTTVLPQRKRIVKLSLDGKFLCEYESFHEAGRDNDINYKNIHTVCNGKRNKAGGFKWMYLDDYKKQKALK